MPRSFAYASLVALCLLSAPAALAAQSQELRWRSGSVLERPVRGGVSHAELVRRLRTGVERHVLVRFEHAPSAHERELWRAAGVELGRALGGGAFFARVRPHAPVGRADVLDGLVDVRELALEWKLHPTLLAGETPQWTVVASDASGASTVAVYVLLQADVDLAAGDALLRALGGSTFDALESVNGLVAFVPRARVAELATADAVAWVEPAWPLLEGTALATSPAHKAALASAPPNDSNRVLTQVNTLQAAPYNLDGSGVDVLVYDVGTARATHMDFGGRVSVRDFSGMDDHSTHCAGTVGGSGAASAGQRRGMAPGCTIESYGFQWNGVGIFYFTNPGDFESDYDEAINVFGADVASNSLASNVEANGYNCHIQGDYGVLEAVIDAVARGSLGTPIPIVFANGNERGGTRCNVEGFGAFYSMGSPATGKNHIAVGAVNSNNDTITTFSSFGPTDDGRLKPDISGPGCQSNVDFGVTSTIAASDTAYGVMCGTSMATPTVSGIVALLLQDYRAQFAGPDPRGSTVKALLAHTAVDRGNVGPDYQFGYGSVRAQSAVDFMRLGQFVEDELAETGARVQWTVSVPAATSELRLTLAWDDAPAVPNVAGSLVNDLDLVVLDPNGARHHVWTLDPLHPTVAAVRTQPDHLNNLEQVLVNSPLAGTWTVEVRGTEIPEGPQGFSLVSSQPLTSVPHVRFSFPSGLPATIPLGVPTPVTVRIVGVSESLVGGSPTLHVRYDGGAFLPLSLSALGGDLYQGVLPPPVCRATPEFTFSAQGTTSGLASVPSTAPDELFTAFAGNFVTVFDDDFQTNQGWTVSNVSVSDGAWSRGTPLGRGNKCDPLTAFGGSGQCYVTGRPNNTDLDGGPTRLISPSLDLSDAGEYEVSYERWFANDNYDADALTVEISNDGGASWTLVETVNNLNSLGGWVHHSFDVAAFVAPTNQVLVRFSATDNPNNSTTEAGLDSFRVVGRSCDPLLDCDHNGILDIDDITGGRANDANANLRIDECEPATGVRPWTKRGPAASAPPVQAPQ